MSNFKVQMVRDRKWLDKVRELPCVACGATPCDPAHIRWGLGGGMGLKPSDDRVVPLCHKHHMEQHRVGEVKFYKEVSRGFSMGAIIGYARSLYLQHHKKDAG